MRRTVLGVAAIALAVVPSIAGASTNHPPRPGEHEFVVSHDPQGRALPHSILVHDTPLVCVTDVL